MLPLLISFYSSIWQPPSRWRCVDVYAYSQSFSHDLFTHLLLLRVVIIIISWISNATISNHRYSLQPFSVLPSSSSSPPPCTVHIGFRVSYGTKVECFRSSIAHSWAQTLEPCTVTSSLIIADLNFAFSNRFDDDGGEEATRCAQTGGGKKPNITNNNNNRQNHEMLCNLLTRPLCEID